MRKSRRQLCFKLVRIAAAGGTLLFFCVGAGAQSQTATTEAEFWPAVDAHFQLPGNYRLLGFVGLKKGEEFPYQQLDTGLGLGYQWKAIAKSHLQNIDLDKEHAFLFGGGYEYLRTLQSGKVKYENRMTLEVTLGFRPLSRILVRDRNRVEFRWVNGVYSTRYRNQLSLEYDILIHKFRLTPYASVEVYYDGAKHSWNEEQYTTGLQWPYKRLLMLDVYYLRQNCATCNPAYLNVGGLTLNFYLRNNKSGKL